MFSNNELNKFQCHKGGPDIRLNIRGLASVLLFSRFHVHDKKMLPDFTGVSKSELAIVGYPANFIYDSSINPKK